MNKLEFAKKMVEVKGDCSSIPLREKPYCDNEKGCPFCIEHDGECSIPVHIYAWAKSVIAGHETEREYKVGDKILIPHAEELLLKGWKVEYDTQMCDSSDDSYIDIEWCGKEVEIFKVDNDSIPLHVGTTYARWYVNPEHLGLPKIKQKVKRSGWIVVHKYADDKPRLTGNNIFATEMEADAHAGVNAIDCVQIEWEE